MTENVTTPIGEPPARARGGSRTPTWRKAVLLAILLALLALIVWATYYYIQNRRLPIPGVTTAAEEVVEPPEYLYSISGPQGADALTRPVGVAVSRGDLVYATDTDAGVVRVYSTDGRYRFTISEVGDGSGTLQAPAHLAMGPDGNLYVSERRLRAVYVFTPEGQYVRKIVPAEPDAAVWSPFAMSFDKDGNLYVTDVGPSDKHRVIVFAPDGTELRRFGSTARANQMSDFPGQFYFPNGIFLSDDGRLFVGDSNNRRVQVFTPEGEFGYLIRTSGIPRGIVIDDKDRLYVVDALAHTVDVYELDGTRIVSFGSQGIGPGQFRYANDVALDRAGRIYVSDRENHQIQVWAWPEEPVVVPGVPETPAQWALCLSPFLLFPPLFFIFRRRRFAVTEDFVDAIAARERLDAMRRRRWRWVTTEAIWPAFEGRVEEGVNLGELIRAEAHSDPDARDLVERMGVSYDEAALLVVSRRAKRLCTEDVRLASLAGALGIDVFDAARFLDRYGTRRGDTQKRR